MNITGKWKLDRQRSRLSRSPNTLLRARAGPGPDQGQRGGGGGVRPRHHPHPARRLRQSDRQTRLPRQVAADCGQSVFEPPESRPQWLAW